MSRDFYEILGVSKSASQDEIKSAYRKLAKEWHPDKHSEDKKKEAEIKFKEIAAAYETLIDSDKRQKYDQFGEDGNKFTSGWSSHVDIDDMGFGFFGRRKPQRGEDIKILVPLTLEESATGITKTIDVPRNDICDKCKGAGGTGSACSACGGQGRVQQKHPMGISISTCPACWGEGVRITTQCPNCSGAGYTTSSKQIEIKIPPGVDTGEAILIQHEGHRSIYDTPRGHVYFVMKISSHPNFTRDNITIRSRAKIPITTAILGGKIPVNTIYGTQMELKIPPGTQPSATFRMKGKGIKKNNLIGDHLIEVQVEIPQKMSDEAKDAFQKFANIYKKR
jgi:molecular chaperone DnaJ